jgi:hypothetical protein
MMIKLSLALLLICVANSSIAADKAASVHGGNGVVLPPPPPTKAEPVTETVQGVAITDPYRWLEEQKKRQPAPGSPPRCNTPKTTSRR